MAGAGPTSSAFRDWPNISPFSVRRSAKIATFSDSSGLFSDSESDPKATQKRTVEADLNDLKVNQKFPSGIMQLCARK